MSESVTLERAAELLSVRDEFIILTHRRPDGDTSGSAAGLCRILRELGKTAHVLPNPDATPLTSQLMAGLYPPDGYVPKTVVSVDIASENLLYDEEKPYLPKLYLALDHHATHDLPSQYECVDATAAAVGELVTELAVLLGAKIGRDTANALFTSITTDTGCFRFSNTTPRTHRAAALLMENGAESARICRERFETVTRARLELSALVGATVRYFAGGKIAAVCITREMTDKTGASGDDTDGMSSISRNIEGVEVGITLREEKDGRGTRVSVRTNEYVDASAVCAAFGGGGHIRASGCTIACGMDEAAKIVAAEAEKYI